MRADGSLHYQRRQGPGIVPVEDALGNPMFDFPAGGPDLVISLQTLKRKLNGKFEVSCPRWCFVRALTRFLELQCNDQLVHASILVVALRGPVLV